MVEREEAGSLFTETSVSDPERELSQRIMARLERTATSVPPGTSGVRGIRSADLVSLVEEAVEPERLKIRAEAERYRQRIADLESELTAVRTASDDTRRFELPRLAALVDVERTRAGELERELDGLEQKVTQLESALRRSEDARSHQEGQLEVARVREEEEEENQAQAEELLLALDQRLAALESQPASRPEDAAHPGSDEERLGALLEEFARSEERAARLAALEEALDQLEGGDPGASARRAAPRSPSTVPLLAEALDRLQRQEARAAELVKTLQVTQELLSREVRRRTQLESQLRGLSVRLAAIERAPLELPEGNEGLGRVVALLRGEGARREQEIQHQVHRLSMATRAALERMASILDQALELGAASAPGRRRASQGTAEALAGLPLPPERWAAWPGEGLADEELDPEEEEEEEEEVGAVEPEPDGYTGAEAEPDEPAPRPEEQAAWQPPEPQPLPAGNGGHRAPAHEPQAQDDGDEHVSSSDWLADLASESARRRGDLEEEPRAAEPEALTASPDPATRRLARSLLTSLRTQADLKSERDHALQERERLEQKAHHAHQALESEVWRGFATHRELISARQRLRDLEERLGSQLERVEAAREGAPPPPRPQPPQRVPAHEDALLRRQAERVADLHREVDDRDSVLHWLMLEADPHYKDDKQRAIRACEQALVSLAASPDAAERAAERDQLLDLLHWLKVENERGASS